MPTASLGAAASSRKGSGNGRPTARSNAAPLLPSTRRPGPTRPSPAQNRGGARGVSPTELLLPVRRDSSIGATSTNPRLRRGSVIEEAAAHRSSSSPHPNTNFLSPESKVALQTLQLLFTPVVLRVVLRRRRRVHWKHGEPPRHYTSSSVVSAIASSKTMLAEWPLRVLEQLADAATFHCLGPKEFIVYAHESHVSCGVVVLLYGHLEERRPETSAKQKGTAGSVPSSTSSRSIRTQTHRMHKATDVLCVMPVLCEDRATSSFATREREEADVAVISSRWFWEVYYGVLQSSLPSSDVLTRYMNDVVAPRRRDIVLADYFPTSVVLLRSWMWPLLTASDRVKLCRAMEVRVLGVGEVLFDEGDYCPYIYIVRRGALTVVVKGEALAVLEAGACLGEESVLFHEKRNSSVIGSTVCELYALHVRHLEHRLTKYPEVGQRVIAAAVERQKQWMEEGKTRDVFGLISILSGVPCLGHSTDAMRGEIARCATVVTVPQGHVLATANTPCTSLFVIGRGSLVLSSVVKPVTPAASTATDGARPGSSAGLNSSLPPKGRPPSSAKNNNPRAAAAGALALNLQDLLAPPEMRREVRSAGDFLGELCLKPHLWPFDVVCDSTVDVWQLDREAILGVLEQNNADAQAIEVCRQGISLYRGQRGEASLIEGFEPPSSPPNANGQRSSSAGRRGSRAPSSQAASRRHSNSPVAPPAPRLSNSVSQLAKLDDSGVLPPAALTEASGKGRCLRSSTTLAPWSPAQWTEYALTRLQEGLAQETISGGSVAAPAVPPAPYRELRTVDKEVEKAMKEKVLRLIAVQPETLPNSADCDISGDGDELQAIIVEQLFLTPTEQQPRFIRQVNDSNVRLVTENDEPSMLVPADLPLEDDELRDPWQSGESPISVGGVMRLEDVNAAAEESQQMHTLASYAFQGAGDATDSGPVARSLVENMEFGGQVSQVPVIGRSRRSTSVAALEDSSTGFMTSFPASRSSISRSLFVRPPSGLPISPRSNVRGELISPRGMSALRPGSSSEPRLPLLTRTRPTSVDYNQLNKVGVDHSTSVLDRYVKIEDQGYFDSYVKVLPLPQDEIWVSDEVVVDDEEMSTGSLVLLLLHVRCCDYLAPEVMQRCLRPMVKVTLGQRVLVRTSVMDNMVSPHWPIEKSSFITFVRRGADIVFTVCDADDEANVVYRCALQTAKIHGDGGVGQQVMTLTEVTFTGEDAEVEGSDTSSSVQRESRKMPRLATTMLAVTASKYKALQQALKPHDDKPQHGAANASTTTDATAPSTTTTLFLQVMSVEYLKHRIEASVTVSSYNGGTLRRLLETNQVQPKTRSPAWPADKAFAKVCGEGGVLVFDLLHRGTVISTAETTVDELAFGGVGLRRLPLLQAQTGNAVMGQLVVGVLGANTADGRESHSRDWVAHVAVEALHLSQENFAITPDPFVVLRDGAGAERLRTPLACGVFDAAWSATEASCLLHCPRLSGSTATYHLEVCDSDAQAVVGRATITVTERGLAGGAQREIALVPPGIGSVRVCSLCLPVLELPEKKQRASLGGGADDVGHPAASPRALPPDAAVLLVHVSGCDDLPDGAMEQFQTDAIGTLAIDGRRFLRTPIREGTTQPRWPFSKASVMLHVPSLDLKSLQGGRHACRFAVYDGVVDEVNQIGQVAVPLKQLLGSASHTYPLFPKAKGKHDRKDGEFGPPSLPLHTAADAPRGRACERTVGKVHLFTLFGRLGQQVEPAGAEETELRADAQDLSASFTPSLSVPYYNPDAASSLLPSNGSATSQATLAGTVLLGVSNVCHVLPNASAKYIHLVVRQGPTPVLSVECAMGTSSHAEWSSAESSAALSRAALAEDTMLSVELSAMDVVEGSGEQAELEKSTAAVAHPATNVTQEKRQQTCIPAERILIGKAELPTAKIISVGLGEVDVITLQLEGAPSSQPPSSAIPSTSAEGKTTVSFCIIGNRS
ncbi:putative 40S ribosomal protein S9 [Leptomonas pyrrhocoris]|uniref:Putative 40S ribosomal protein S9 n=1 Tax=Leptomonas pyrrhocoris TaxID=157538 RepID=A0A0M9G0K1_LEPPY|nr:putative 40S ribosomal protein S9 [Leptomonas pyrrhocoris]KPA79950.1 putative 40S ribosomal protein S9 [Leptomonas pyrrhocoris]|eukprot:XP_015658389.1 putative 40S ribosomal protein S9 [Leptomonas pyrrhocoris]